LVMNEGQGSLSMGSLLNKKILATPFYRTKI